MTEVERTFGDLMVEMADGLCKLLNPKHPTSAENFADGIANATEAFREASAKQHDEDRNGIRRKTGKADCAEAGADDLPIPEEDCRACKGTGMRGPDRACGACEGTGIAGAEPALPEAEAAALRKIITAGMDVWGDMSCGVETEWVVDTIVALLDGGDSMSDDDLAAAARKVYETQWGEIKAARETKKG